MQIRDCNRLCYISVVTNDGEELRILHKMPFDVLSVLGTVGTTANVDQK